MRMLAKISSINHTEWIICSICGDILNLGFTTWIPWFTRTIRQRPPSSAGNGSRLKTQRLNDIIAVIITIARISIPLLARPTKTRPIATGQPMPAVASWFCCLFSPLKTLLCDRTSYSSWKLSIRRLQSREGAPFPDRSVRTLFWESAWDCDTPAFDRSGYD